MKLIRITIVLLALIGLSTTLFAATATSPPLANAVILIIRHGEKPDTGTGLTPQGRQRALAYVHYFETYRVDGKLLHIDRIIATADTKKSWRERLTVTPLSQALHLPIDQSFHNKDVAALAAAVQTRLSGKAILVCWHHGEIPDLLQAFGVKPASVIPGGTWPDDTFDWVIQLRYDAKGHLLTQHVKRIVEHLIQGDK